ncbi:hypothetical protein BsWGS_28284 [Bradybaena similaris]
MVLGERDGFMVSGERDGFMVSGERDGFMVSGERDGFMVSRERDGFMVSGERSGFMVSGGTHHNKCGLEAVTEHLTRKSAPTPQSQATQLVDCHYCTRHRAGVSRVLSLGREK